MKNKKMVKHANSFENWCRLIMDEEGLTDWTLDTTAHGDGLTQISIKNIICTEDHHALFLHELTHAVLGKSRLQKDKTGHDSVWADIFTVVCHKYLRPATILTIPRSKK